MGKKKTNISYIENYLLRKICFDKRKKGLKKKLEEFCNLIGVEGFLEIENKEFEEELQWVSNECQMNNKFEDQSNQGIQSHPLKNEEKNCIQIVNEISIGDNAAHQCSKTEICCGNTESIKIEHVDESHYESITFIDSHSGQKSNSCKLKTSLSAFKLNPKFNLQKEYNASIITSLLPLHKHYKHPSSFSI